MLRLFAFDKAEVFHVAYHETVVPDVAAQIVHTALPDVAKVAYPEGEAGNGKVQRQEMAHGRSVSRMDKADIMVVVAQRHFVIRLAVIGGEYAAGEREACLLAYGERHFADVKRIDGYQ